MEMTFGTLLKLYMKLPSSTLAGCVHTEKKQVSMLNLRRLEVN